ncbi:hypothetical protein V5799_005875 [Amblyomma americanum]|uniref:Uncharacterized protein n=1 Tax=Amblyomma americanum TaxID=6943 RepID=A0AAQ4DXZ5_AMBAM
MGKVMVVRFAFSISQQLDSHPKARVTVRREDGSKILCLGRVGSCTYRLCRGITFMDKELGKPWNNKCPVPATSGEEYISVTLDNSAEMLIPFTPTTFKVRVAVTDGSTVVGCETFDVKIEAA